MKGATADPLIFDPAAPMSGQAKYFNSECGDMDGSPEWCADSMRLTVGSSSIDYSDPTAPVIKKLVAIGGRGISIYKLTDTGLDLVWDSADEFEREGCAAYPWAHNGIQDEEFADVNGTLYMADEGIRETIEEMNDPEEDGCDDRGDGQPGGKYILPSMSKLNWICLFLCCISLLLLFLFCGCWFICYSKLVHWETQLMNVH